MYTNTSNYPLTIDSATTYLPIINSHLPAHTRSQARPESVPSSVCNPPWLPASKGDIKKYPKTLFANSSPISYKAMPASVESSDTDKTSFVEKSFIHKIVFPVSYYLEVAKFWALSNRSELECRFTVAQSSEQPKKLSDLQKQFGESRRPISHARLAERALPPKKLASNKRSAAAEEDLLRSINRFMECCRLKDKSLSNSDLSPANGVGSESRRYLSQIMALMSEGFAKKLVKTNEKSGDVINSSSSRKRATVSLSTSRVKVITMTSSVEEQRNADKEKFVIIHIPKRKKTSNDVIEEVDAIVDQEHDTMVTDNKWVRWVRN